jgi:hypothetical protein
MKAVTASDRVFEPHGLHANQARRGVRNGVEVELPREEVGGALSERAWLAPLGSALVTEVQLKRIDPLKPQLNRPDCGKAVGLIDYVKSV